MPGFSLWWLHPELHRMATPSSGHCDTWARVRVGSSECHFTNIPPDFVVSTCSRLCWTHPGVDYWAERRQPVFTVTRTVMPPQQPMRPTQPHCLHTQALGEGSVLCGLICISLICNHVEHVSMLTGHLGSIFLISCSKLFSIEFSLCQ